MFKNMKMGIWVFIALIFTSLVTVSCNKDDEEPELPENVYDINNLIYGGTTSATLLMGGQSIPFSTQETKWHFDINPETNLCNVYLIDAQFAQAMPKVQLYLFNLHYNPAKQTITGNNIVASMEEGGAITPSPRYTFENFSAKFKDEHHSAVEVDFTVANVGYGSFKSESIIM